MFEGKNERRWKERIYSLSINSIIETLLTVLWAMRRVDSRKVKDSKVEAKERRKRIGQAFQEFADSAIADGLKRKRKRTSYGRLKEWEILGRIKHRTSGGRKFES